MKIKNGFTLIEILVVIMIIGLIVGGIALNLARAQKKGRDTQRITDMTSVAQALGAYYADKHIYPTGITNDGGANYNNLSGQLIPSYIQVLPQEVNDDYVYRYACSGTPICSKYVLAVKLELERVQPNGSSANGYKINTGEVDTYIP